MQTNAIVAYGNTFERLSGNVNQPVGQKSVTDPAEFRAILQSGDVKNVAPISISTVSGNSTQNDSLRTNSQHSKASVSRAFETMLVAQFLKPLLSGSEESVFGNGLQGDITKSLLIDAIAQTIAERSGLGLGKFV